MWVEPGLCVHMSNYRAERRGENCLWTSPFLPLSSLCLHGFLWQKTATHLTQETFPFSSRVKDRELVLLLLVGCWVSATMEETESGNGEEVASVTSGFVSSWLQVASGAQALREELQASRTVERFDVPLKSLREMFEKPAVTSTVSTAAGCRFCLCNSGLSLFVLVNC